MWKSFLFPKLLCLWYSHFVHQAVRTSQHSGDSDFYDNHIYGTVGNHWSSLLIPMDRNLKQVQRSIFLKVQNKELLSFSNIVGRITENLSLGTII